jgi:uroporphyrin-III C-methyltransferase
MGRSAAADISRNLIAHGLDPKTPVLIACDVSLASERCLRTRLDLLPLAVQTVAENKPTLILVGEAVRQNDAAEIARIAAKAHR